VSNQIPTGFSEEFTQEVQLKLQQRGSRFAEAATRRSFTGKDAKAVEQLGSVVAQKKTTRHADTPLMDTPHDARWVYPVDYEFADLIDPQDELRAIASFESSYVMNAASAMMRAQDDEIINAIFSDTTKTGEDGGTTLSWNTYSTVTATGHLVASGSVGMTVAKLRAAKKALLAAEVDLDFDPLFCAISAEEHDDLLGETLATSLDYNTRPVLVDGAITSFMGFNFINSERLNISAGSVTSCPAFAKSGLLLGVWGDVQGKVDERADKSYATQVYAKTTIGATRLEEGKFVEILCDQS
tara:strand:+ start:236 stop:1129 length:894 start_codon:yes stop_codon:yes gene_type:complete